MPPRKKASCANSLQGKILVFTGTLQQPRAAAKKEAEKAGATVAGSVSGKTDILVAGPGAGQKIAAAEAKGVTIWTEEQFLVAVSGCSSSAESEESESVPTAKGKKTSAVKAAPLKNKSKRKAAESTDEDDIDIKELDAPAHVTKKHKKESVKKQASAAAPTSSPTGNVQKGRRPDSNLPGASAFQVEADFDTKLVLSNIQGPIGNNKVRVPLLLNYRNGIDPLLLMSRCACRSFTSFSY